MRLNTLILLLGMIFVTHQAFAKGETDYSSIDIHEGELYEKPTATKDKPKKPSHASKSSKSTHSTKKKKSSVMSCRTAFTTGSKSPSTGEVSDAADICEAATQKACAKNSDGTGDGRYITAACFLDAAYKANISVNENKATKKCEKARNEAMDSPSTGDVSDAIDVCKEETQSICAKLADGTGDGRLIAANCMLTAAHGGFIGVTVKEKPRPKAADANLCGGKAAPRICKGNCYVNYECRNNSWEKSPIESCALCGDAANGLNAIDIHEGEKNINSAE